MSAITNTGRIVKLADDVDYSISFSMNEIVDIEDKYGDIEAIPESMGAYRFLLWLGLRRKYDLTVEEVGELMSGGCWGKAESRLLLEALTEAISGPEGVASLDKPQKRTTKKVSSQPKH